MGTPRHTALLYRNEQLFTESASAFVKPGPDKDTTVLAIVTEKHRQDLSEVLANKGQRNEKLIFVDATDCLTQFMVEGWPDQPLFMHTTDALIGPVFQQGPVRVLGEMVAVLCNEGKTKAAIRL